MFKQRTVLFACVLALASVLAYVPALAQIPRGVRESALTSAVQVRVKTKWGGNRRCSGYLFSTQGIVITTFAAVSDAASIEVYQADLGVLDVSRIRRLDKRTNLAVLMVSQQLPSDTPIAQLGDSRTVAVGDEVYVLHHAEHQSSLVYETTIKGLGYPQQLAVSDFTSSYAQETILFRVDGPFDAGSAGAIVCNASWNVIGMLVGSVDGSNGQRSAYAIPAGYLPSLANSSYDAEWSQLASGAKSDADYFDGFFGPASKERGFQEPMTGGYIAWFAPMYPASYRDPDFMTEINDKVKKSWFASYDLKIDNRPLREISGSQVVVWSATTNPWGVGDGLDRYVNFDADSLFSKRVYKDRQTEERIMTRHILALELAPGKHFLQYENKGANFKSTGIKRRSVSVVAGTVQTLDIKGLSLVQMDRLPPPPAGVGEKNSVKYELTRRPLGDKELIYGIRSGWYER